MIWPFRKSKRPTLRFQDGCRLTSVGEIEPDGARWIYCRTCGITGKAYAYPSPNSHVRCFRREVWADDKGWQE